MIRFRVGQSFRADAATRVAARDGLSLELDGVPLWPEVADAPLLEVAGRFVEAVTALYRGERGAQVALDDGALEISLWRPAGTSVEVALLDLGRAPRLVRPPVRVELEELGDAVARAARELARDVEVAQRAGAPAVAAVLGRLERLGQTVLETIQPKEVPGFSSWRTTHAGLGFGLTDEEDRLASCPRQATAGLPFLLGTGWVETSSGARVDGPPFLTLLGLARRALEADPELGGERVPAPAALEAGLDFCVALRGRNPALGSNPWLETLEVRCTEALALRHPVTPGGGEADASLRPTAPRAAPPLVALGAIRRVSLERRWSKPVLVGEPGGRLLLGRDFVAVAAPRAAHVFSRAGRSRRELRSPLGVALTPRGEAVVATEDRVLLYGPRGGARWLRDHDGVRVGPETFELAGRVVTSLDGRGLLAFDRVTGREVWRFAPPRTSRVHVAVVGGRVLVGTDGGMVHGIDPVDGTVRFRIRGPLPCVAPPVGLARGAVCVLGRGEQAVVFAFDAASADEGKSPGTIRFSRELALSHPCRAAVQRQRLYAGGLKDGRAVVVCLSDGGRVLWERSVPLDGASLTLQAFEGGVIATDVRGAATRLLPDGQPAWVVGSSGDALERPIAARLERQVLVVPGPVLRLIDPRGGRTLGELEAGPHLADVALARNFDVFVYREPGELSAWRPGATLSVVR